MEFICAHCGYLGQPCYPGLIYSIWRLSSRAQECPSCGATPMIPAYSPRGNQLVTQFHPTLASGPQARSAGPYKGDAAKGRMYLAIFGFFVLWVLYKIFLDK